MSEEGHAPVSPSRRQLLLLSALALILGTAIMLLAVLPAEFRLDPLGLGRMTGLDRLAGPAEVVVTAVGDGAMVHFYDTPFRTDSVDIPLKRSGTFGGDELEWKVRMREGETLIYSWSVSGITDPEEFYFDFHGQTEPGQGESEIKVISYREGSAKGENGALVAPFDGLHGWFLQNQSNVPVIVHLNLAGHYAIATQEDISAAGAAARALPQ